MQSGLLCPFGGVWGGGVRYRPITVHLTACPVDWLEKDRLEDVIDSFCIITQAVVVYNPDVVNQDKETKAMCKGTERQTVK